MQSSFLRNKLKQFSRFCNKRQVPEATGFYMTAGRGLIFPIPIFSHLLNRRSVCRVAHISCKSGKSAHY